MPDFAPRASLADLSAAPAPPRCSNPRLSPENSVRHNRRSSRRSPGCCLEPVLDSSIAEAEAEAQVAEGERGERGQIRWHLPTSDLGDWERGVPLKAELHLIRYHMMCRCAGSEDAGARTSPLNYTSGGGLPSNSEINVIKCRRLPEWGERAELISPEWETVPKCLFFCNLGFVAP